MARQKGIVKLSGSIGDFAFYKTGDGYMAREKSGVDGNRIKNDPAFQRTRENGSEFGRAGKASKLLRSAIRQLLQNAADPKVTSRLTREMLRVIQTDPINERGKRTVTAGVQGFLKGFDFNINSKLSTTLFAQYLAAIDRAAGTLTVSLPDFVPENTVTGPDGATHVRIVSAGAALDFATETFEVTVTKSADIALGTQLQEAVVLTNAVTAASPLSLYLVMGLEFLQEVNGQMYSLRSGGFNPLMVVAVDQPVAAPEG